jgi:hypothetical protein
MSSKQLSRDVGGSRYQANWAPSYSTLSLNKLSGFHFKGASDFKLMNRKAVDAWLKMHERNVFFRGMTVWMGFTTVQIPFEVVPRQQVNRPGQS